MTRTKNQESTVRATTKRKPKAKAVPPTSVRLDLACGDNKKEGFIGVDKFKTASADVVFDLLDQRKKWPWANDSVDEVHCSHFFEHIPGMDRPRFMEELFRILKKGATAVIITPYGSSNRAFQDFTHAWPPVFAESFLYFNKEWRTGNKLTHGYYDLTCDFDFSYGIALSQEWIPRADAVQQFAAKHYTNAATDLQVTLTKR